MVSAFEFCRYGQIFQTHSTKCPKNIPKTSNKPTFMSNFLSSIDAWVMDRTAITLNVIATNANFRSSISLEHQNIQSVWMWLTYRLSSHPHFSFFLPSFFLLFHVQRTGRGCRQNLLPTFVFCMSLATFSIIGICLITRENLL